MTTADAASMLLQPEGEGGGFARWIALWDALHAAENQARQMSRNLGAGPRTQIPRQLQMAKVRAASGQALLTYANQFFAGSAPPSVPSVDPSFSGLKSWFQNAKSGDRDLLRMGEPAMGPGTASFSSAELVRAAAVATSSVSGSAASVSAAAAKVVADMLQRLRKNPSTVVGKSAPSDPPSFVTHMKKLVAQYNGIAAELQTSLKRS